MNRAIKYRAYPTEEQVTLFNKTCGCIRWYWNHALSDALEFRAATDIPFVATPAKYKSEAEFLKEVDSLALANTQLSLQSAWHKYFTEKNISEPQYKARKKNDVTSYTTNRVGNNIVLRENSIRLPKIGDLRIRKHRSPKNGWHLKSVTVSVTADKMYVSVLFEIKQQPPQKMTVSSADDVLGLDYSMPHLYVDSNGNEPGYSRYYYLAQNRLADEQRKLSHMVAGSSNYKKQRHKVSALQAHTANQRKDFLHKLSAQITNEYKAVGVEDINLRGMAGALHFGKRTNDNGFGMLRNMIQYKIESQGGYFIVIDKFLPSTQSCSCCGYVLSNEEKLSLKDRLWICPCCHTEHNRDVNAAVNIRNAAFEMLNRIAV